MRQRTLLLVGLLACLVIAGIGSYYASTHPDGLERVAESTGFVGSAEDSAVADSPIAGYEVDGVEDDRLSGGLAGVIGVAVVGVLATGLFWALRRRRVEATDEPADSRG